MAKPGPKPSKNVGKTAKFYQENPKSRAKHSSDNNSGSGGKYAHSNEYKRRHADARKSLQIKPGSNVDASKQPDGTFRKEKRSTNRARGGAKRR